MLEEANVAATGVLLFVAAILSLLGFLPDSATPNVMGSIYAANVVRVLKTENLREKDGIFVCFLLWLSFTAKILSLVLQLKRFIGTIPSPTSNLGAGPWFLPCKTSHSRRFPKEHSFSYSYLQVALKVGLGSVHGRMLAIEGDRENDGEAPWTWFSISSDDYLFREKRKISLRKKVDEYLRSESVDPDTLPNVYLVTAPRFLGYSFNPVSFWYLHDDCMELQYMTLEVNNTFDERRPYLLKRDTRGDCKSEGDPDGRFKQSWPKDFHVSPFSSRKGSYSLNAIEPSWAIKSPPWINNTITLMSSKDHAKLVARLFSTEPGVRVDAMRSFDKARFVMSWFWVGFMTFPRILKEAAKLFFGRKLHVWYRPEVLRKSMGRRETSRERLIEQAFEHFLNNQSLKLNIQTQLTKSWESPNSKPSLPLKTKNEMEHQVRIHIHSPEAFTRYALDPKFFVNPDAMSSEAKTFSIWGNEKDIARLFPIPTGCPEHGLSISQKIFRVSQCLQARFYRAPKHVLHPLDESMWTKSVKFRTDSKLKSEYALAISSLTISEMVSFGVPELLDFMCWILKVYLAWSLTGILRIRPLIDDSPSGLKMLGIGFGLILFL